MATQSELDIDHRRRLVARMLARRALERLGLRGIALALADETLPDYERSVAPNGEPWSIATISRDVAFIRQGWQREAMASVVEVRAQQLATLDELLVTALGKVEDVNWMSEARQVIAQQARLLGTDSDQTRVHALVSQQMNLGLDRLEREFAKEPALLHRVITALVGNEVVVPPTIPAQLEA